MVTKWSKLFFWLTLTLDDFGPKMGHFEKSFDISKNVSKFLILKNYDFIEIYLLYSKLFIYKILTSLHIINPLMPGIQNDPHI